MYQIKEMWYWGDQFMTQVLTAIKKIIYNSDDTNKFKIDDTEDGRKNEIFFRQELYRILKESNSTKLKYWLRKYEEDFHTQLGNVPYNTYLTLFNNKSIKTKPGSYNDNRRIPM